MKNNVGQVTQVLGAVVDVQFPAELPAIMNALTLQIGEQKLVLEWRSTWASAPCAPSPWTRRTAWCAARK
jgi:F0F1-type ATP synthase beta subunit